MTMNKTLKYALLGIAAYAIYKQVKSGLSGLASGGYTDQKDASSEQQTPSSRPMQVAVSMPYLQTVKLPAAWTKEEDAKTAAKILIEASKGSAQAKLIADSNERMRVLLEAAKKGAANKAIYNKEISSAARSAKEIDEKLKKREQRDWPLWKSEGALLTVQQVMPNTPFSQNYSEEQGFNELAAKLAQQPIESLVEYGIFKEEGLELVRRLKQAEKSYQDTLKKWEADEDARLHDALMDEYEFSVEKNILKRW
jgi:hypothetical protein